MLQKNLTYARVKNHIKVMWFFGSLDSDSIVAVCQFPGRDNSLNPFPEISVNTEEFRKYIQDRPEPDWMMCYRDNETSCTVTGKMDWDEYKVILPPAEIAKDLSLFISLKTTI